MRRKYMPFDCKCMKNYQPYHRIIKRRKGIVLLECMECGARKFVSEKALLENVLRLRKGLVERSLHK
jgi:uncharacterized Zn finger protein